MTQLDTLKAAFERGESFTVGEALGRHGIYALSQRVGELKRSGYPIVVDMETTSTGKRIARYSKLKVAYG